jgi:hypothetical protein
MRWQGRNVRLHGKTALIASMALLLSWLLPPLARSADIAVACTTPALIAAIDQANADAQPDTLTLASGCTYVLTTPNNTADGPSGLPAITSPITIVGNGATITRADSTDPNYDFRLLYVAPNGSLMLYSLMLQRGSLVAREACGGGINPRSVEPPQQTDHEEAGAGILNTGTLSLIDTTIKESVANGGGGIFNTGVLTLTSSVVMSNTSGFGNGSGILNQGVTTVLSSTISDNIGLNSGAGIENASGSMLVIGSIVERNQMKGACHSAVGGGIANGAALTLVDSVVRENVASGNYFGDGAGIFNTGALTVTNSTISANSTDGDGGGIKLVSGSATLANTTISGNSANGDGGGLYLSDATLAISSTTIVSNTADTNANGLGDGGGLFVASGIASVENTIIAANFDTPGNAGPGNIYPDVGVDNQTYLAVRAIIDAFFQAPPDLEFCVTGPSFPAPGCQRFTFSAFPFDPPGNIYVWRNLVPGTYTVTQRPSSSWGWEASGLPATVTVTLGATTMVTATNRFSGYSMLLPVVVRQAMPGSSLVQASRAATQANATRLKLGQLTAVPATGTLSSAGFNLIGDGSGADAFVNGVGGDQVGSPASRIDPRLGPLANNGGPTPTRAPLAGSPAIDTGPNGPCATSADQRGVVRPQGQRCDIGAVEVAGTKN